MKTNRLLLTGALHALFFAATAAFAADTTPPATEDFATEIFGKGSFSLNVRARYESVGQTGLKDADAYTVRTRLGYTTAPFHGFKAMIEVEDITPIDGDRYSQAGINPGGTGRAVVADPKSTEINQVWASCTLQKSVLTLGRQRLVLDNARFVGDVGWRQNMQTFDAISLVDKTVDKLTFNYAYLYQIDRVFGKTSTQGVWRSDSHLFNASYSGLPYATLTGYAYLLDFKNSATNSCATYGASVTWVIPVEKLKVSYRAEYATQSDYRNNPATYSTRYWTGELGLATKTYLVAGGYEALGSDKNIGFKTPLATLHAFNGWADLFLATPAGGLDDTYGKAGVNFPGGYNLLAFYHKFSTETGTSLGKEWDLQLAHKFGKRISGLVKYADFRRDTTTVANVKKFWVQVEFAY